MALGGEPKGRNKQRYHLRRQKILANRTNDSIASLNSGKRLFSCVKLALNNWLQLLKLQRVQVFLEERKIKIHTKIFMHYKWLF